MTYSFAVYLIMHACAWMPIDSADRYADRLLTAKLAMQDHDGDWTPEEKRQYVALSEMVGVCTSDIMRQNTPLLEAATAELQKVNYILRVEIARREARRRFWRRVRRLGF